VAANSAVDSFSGFDLTQLSVGRTYTFAVDIENWAYDAAQAVFIIERNLLSVTPTLVRENLFVW